MTSGTASTSGVKTIPNAMHSINNELPFQPRRLNRGERSRHLTHVFFSPRNNRVVTVADTINAAAAMKFEFQATLAAYVERPRRLQLTPRQQIDVAFWTRAKTGEERFVITVPDSGNIGSTSGMVSMRDPDLLADVAERHEIVLHTLTEATLRSEMAWLKVCNELLLHVWEYSRQPARTVIRHQIEGYLLQVPRVSLSALLRNLAFTETAVKSVVAAMVHEGGIRLVDYTPGLIDAVLEVGNA